MPFRSLRWWTLSAWLFAIGLAAQQNDIPLQRDIYLDVERNAACRTARIHTGLKPVIQSRADLTGVMGFRPDSARRYYWLTEVLFRRHLLQVRHKGVRLHADLLLDLQLGQDLREDTRFADTTRFHQNTRGFRIAGDLGPRFSFHTAFFENQAIYPQYLWNRTRELGVVPGQGRVKPFNGRAFDFAWAMGGVSWSPRRWLNVQLGQGRHQVGHGYRSMLLSDASSTYPYLELSWLGWKDRLQYSTIHARLNMLKRLPTGESSESLFLWKRATFSHLSLELGRVSVGLFEATIFKSIDSSGVRPFNALYVNPVIGVNTLVNGFDGDHKQVVGLDLRVKLTDKLHVYGQGVTDKPGRYGWQAGFRWFDVLGLDMHLQAEYNSAQPFLYMQRDALTAHTHTQQPLAHPYGANFDEVVVVLDHRIRGKVLLQAKLNLATLRTDGPDSLGGNHGSDLLLPDRASPLPDGPIERRLTYLDLSASYLINQMSNMRFTLGYWMRDLTPAPDHQNTGYLYAAFRMALFNRYYDF